MCCCLASLTDETSDIFFFIKLIAAHHTNPGPLVFPLEVVTSIRRRRTIQLLLYI